MDKYFYLYKITNNITGEYYYGVHETFKLDDGYFGSGATLKENIKQYGLENFVKEILEFFPNRKELMNEEKRIVNKELLKDPKCLNVILGGGELKGSVGKRCVVDENGNYKMVDVSDDTYQNFMIGRICINKDGNMKYIKPYELDYYVKNGWEKGTIYDSPGKGKIWIHSNDKYLQIYENELQKYLDEGWKKGFKGVGNTIWVNKKGNSKQINKDELQNYLNNEWELGFKQKTVNGLICVMKNDGRKYIKEEDFQKYIGDGWQKFTWKNTIWINKNNQNKRIYKEDLQNYLNDNWKIGRYNKNNTRRKGVLLYDLNGNLIKEFKKVVDANKEGYNNIHKYADKNKIYMGKYILKYKL